MIAEAIDALITERLRVLVEELGGREGPVMPVHSEYVRHERRLFDALVKHAPVVQMSDDLVGDVVKTLEVLAESLNACRAQQRENAETIAALKERVETAEAANTELDNARKSAEQSARDLRAMRDKLRAELDAIKGAQVPYRWAVVDKEGMSFTFTSLEKAQAWAIGDRGGVVPLYTHPAPALPVVGACVVNTNGEVTHWWRDRWIARDGDVLEEIARKENGALHKLLLGDKIGAPLPTEGGK